MYFRERDFAKRTCKTDRRFSADGEQIHAAGYFSRARYFCAHLQRNRGIVGLRVGDQGILIAVRRMVSEKGEIFVKRLIFVKLRDIIKTVGLFGESAKR